MKRLLKVLAATATLSLMGIAPSMAAFYTPTLNVYNGSGIHVGQGYGTYEKLNTSSGTVNRMTGATRDLHPGGNSIYWQADFSSSAGICIAPQYTSCTQQFYAYNSVQGTRSNGSGWLTSWNQAAVNRNATSTRANFKVCEDQRFAVDPCSWAHITGAYNY